MKGRRSAQDPERARNVGAVAIERGDGGIGGDVGVRVQQHRIARHARGWRGTTLSDPLPPKRAMMSLTTLSTSSTLRTGWFGSTASATRYAASTLAALDHDVPTVKVGLGRAASLARFSDHRPSVPTLATPCRCRSPAVAVVASTASGSANATVVDFAVRAREVVRGKRARRECKRVLRVPGGVCQLRIGHDVDLHVDALVRERGTDMRGRGTPASGRGSRPRRPRAAR